MASLIGPLASGVKGCESGTAEIYQRGTSSAAVVYTYDSSRDTLTQVTTHPLDANGGTSRYVVDPVDVVCKDSSGNVIRTFTWESRADIVEVRNAGFTGTLSTGSQGGGGRTDLDTVLTSLYSSLGATDGKVLVGGSSQNIRDVLSGTSGVFFSVTNTAYGGGAKGNDTADDTGAFQAAVNAAVSAGGGIVYIPPGTYKITTSIAVASPKVFFLGVEQSACTIKFYGSSSTPAVSMPGTGGTFMNLTFSQGAAQVLAVGEMNGCRFYNCTFNSAGVSGAFGYLNLSAGTSIATFLGCTFNQTGTSGSMFSVTGSTAPQIQLLGGAINISATLANALVFSVSSSTTFQFQGVTINYSAAGTSQIFPNGVGSLNAVFSGCYFPAGGGTLNVGPTSGAFPTVIDAGNFIAQNAGIQFLFAPLSIQRENNGIRTSNSATSYTPDSLRYQFHDYTSSGASMTFQNPSGVPGSSGLVAQRVTLKIRYKNTSGGAITPAFGTAYKIGTAPSVGNNQSAVWNFVYDTINGFWLQEGANPTAYAS